MRQTRKSLRDRARSATARAILGRFRVAATDAALWALERFSDFDGNVETTTVEVFGGIGFKSRPAASDRAEAIVAKVGGESGHPVIIATRDRDMAKAIAAIVDMAADSSAIFNSQVRVHCEGDKVYIDDGTGAVELALKSDVENLATHVDQHTHQEVVNPSGPTTALTSFPTKTPTGAPVLDPAPSATGTTVLKGK